MGKIHPTDIKFMVVLVLCLSMAFPISANDFLFTSIDTSHGLSDNQIRYILQLPDGRMVFTTTQNVNLYDGANFTSLQPTPEYIYPLKQYKGFYHVYLSGDSLLWIKDYQRLMCINLHNERYIANLDSVFQQKGMQHPIEDLFADERGLVWVISHGELLQPELSFRLKLSEGRGTIQDLTADEESLYLFHDTVENNIKFGCPGATHKQVVEAAKKACCHDFISALPDGYNTVIGEGGATLSGGEKQRISIARCLLKDAPIVIFDEATANVDPENEDQLQKAMEALTREKTVLMIAHRLKTVRGADQILVVDQGRVVQKGTHDELIRQAGIYRDFVSERTESSRWTL